MIIMLGENLKRCRKTLDISKTDFASMADITMTFLRLVENKNRNLSYEKLNNIVEASGYPIDYFIGEGNRTSEILTIIVLTELIKKSNDSNVVSALSNILGE